MYYKGMGLGLGLGLGLSQGDDIHIKKNACMQIHILDE